MNTIKKGQIFSELSYYTVIEEVKGSNNIFLLENDSGEEINVSSKYINKLLTSADKFDNIEKKTKTEMESIIAENPRQAMTVCFIKADSKKTAKAYKEEKEVKIEQIKTANLESLPKLLDDLIENPLSKVIPGEERALRGRHYGIKDPFGNFRFIDMDIDNGDVSLNGTEQDKRWRPVNPRTLQWVIVNNVKYILK